MALLTVAVNDARADSVPAASLATTVYSTALPAAPAANR